MTAKETVLAFYEAYEKDKDVEKCKLYLGEQYKQHNPWVLDGPEAFLNFVQFRHDHYPEGRNYVKLIVADEEQGLVALHVHSVLGHGLPDRNLVDTFRVVDGKIVEHWDAIMDIPEKPFPPINGNGYW